MSDQKPKKILYAAYLESLNKDIKECPGNINTKAEEIKLDSSDYILDNRTAQLLSGVKLTKEDISLLNKFTYDEIIILKSLVDKVLHKNVGRKKKVIPITVDTVNKLKATGMTDQDIANKYNVSLSTIRKFRRENKYD